MSFAVTDKVVLIVAQPLSPIIPLPGEMTP